MNVSKDFEELFESLTAHQVKALIVGGYAVAFHARPRYTKDIDILIEPTPENADRLLAALADFGFGELGLVPAGGLEDEAAALAGEPLHFLVQPQRSLGQAGGHGGDDLAEAAVERGGRRRGLLAPALWPAWAPALALVLDGGPPTGWRPGLPERSWLAKRGKLAPRLSSSVSAMKRPPTTGSEIRR